MNARRTQRPINIADELFEIADRLECARRARSVDAATPVIRVEDDDEPTVRAGLLHAASARAGWHEPNRGR